MQKTEFSVLITHEYEQSSGYNETALNIVNSRGN